MNHICTTMDHTQTHTRLGHRLSPKGAPVVSYANDRWMWHQKDKCQCRGTKLRVYSQLKALDAVNSFGFSLIWKTPGHDRKALDSMNNSRLWMTCTTLGLKLRALDAVNSSRLWLVWTNLGHKIWALDAMNTSGLSMTLATLGREPALDAMNNYGYGWNEILWFVSLGT